MSLLKNGEVASGAVLAALGVYIVLESRHWEYLGPDGPGPGFFPMWYGIGLVILSIALIATNWKRESAAASAEEKSGRRRAFSAWVALLVCVALLKPLGFPIAFGLYSIYLVKFLYGEPLGKALAVGIGGSLTFYLLFDKALNVSLPAGLFGF